MGSLSIRKHITARAANQPNENAADCCGNSYDRAVSTRAEGHYSRNKHKQHGQAGACPIKYVAQARQHWAIQSRFPQPHAGAATILWDELNASRFESGSQLAACCLAPPDLAPLSFEPFDSRNRYAGSGSKLLLRPAHKRPCCFNLPD